MSDIGRYVAHVLTTLPPDQLEWKEFRIQGELTTLTKVIVSTRSSRSPGLSADARLLSQAAIEQATGQHYEVVRRDLTTAKAELPQAKGLAALFDFIAVSVSSRLFSRRTLPELTETRNSCKTASATRPSTR